MIILKEAVYTPDTIFVDSVTGKSYKWDGQAFRVFNAKQSSQQSSSSNSQSKSEKDQNNDKASNSQNKSDKEQKGDSDKPSKEYIKKLKDQEDEYRRQHNVKKETPEQLADRLARLDKLLNDTNTAKNIDRETYEKIRAEKKAKAEKEMAELRRQANTGIQGFKNSFNDFIKDLLRRSPYQTYNKLNKTYNANTGRIIKPGRRMQRNPEVPLIRVYFDRSGSWGDDDIAQAKTFLESLRPYERRGLIKIEIRYFAGNEPVQADPNDLTTGGTAGQPIIDDIKKSKPQNVIVMTDSDIDYQDPNMEHVEVPGGVWLLWKGNEHSDVVRQAIRGKKSNKEFEINRV